MLNLKACEIYQCPLINRFEGKTNELYNIFIKDNAFGFAFYLSYLHNVLVEHCSKNIFYFILYSYYTIRPLTMHTKLND